MTMMWKPLDAAVTWRQAQRPWDLPKAEPARIGSFRVRLHGEIATVEAIWRRMQQTGFCTVYQTVEWASGLARDMIAAEGARLLIAEVTDGASGRTLMLLPLVLRRRHVLRVIEWLDLGVCDYAAPVLAEGVVFTPAEAVAAWAAVKSALPPIDLILIDGVPSMVRGVPNPLAALPVAAASDQRAFGIALEGDPATLLTRLCGPSFARDIRKGERRLARQGELRFVVAEGAQQTADLFDVLLEQRLRRFRALGRADLLQRPHVAAFYRGMARDGAAGGPARLFGVSVDGDWIATAYGLVHESAFHGILLAMGDERWRNASPGLYLVAEIMRWARAQDLTYFDMTVGALAYKSAMGARGQDLLALDEATTLSGHLFLAARRCAVASKAWLRRHPALFDRLRSIRQAERRLGAVLARPAAAAAQEDGQGHG